MLMMTALAVVAVLGIGVADNDDEFTAHGSSPYELVGISHAVAHDVQLIIVMAAVPGPNDNANKQSHSSCGVSVQQTETRPRAREPTAN